MEIRPDLSLCLLPEEDGTDPGPCLEALLACADPLSLEIYLPHNVSCRVAFDSPHIHCIDVADQSGAAFVQEVWPMARGRYLGLWRGGVIPQPAALFTLIEFLDDHPDVAGAGPRFFSEQGEILATAFGRRRFLPLADPVMPGWDGLVSQEVEWLSGAALIINSLALADITLPDARLGGVWERALCRRLQRQGWHIFFVHLARVMSQQAFCEPASPWLRLVDGGQRFLARWLK